MATKYRNKDLLDKSKRSEKFSEDDEYKKMSYSFTKGYCVLKYREFMEKHKLTNKFHSYTFAPFSNQSLSAENCGNNCTCDDNIHLDKIKLVSLFSTSDFFDFFKTLNLKRIPSFFSKGDLLEPSELLDNSMPSCSNYLPLNASVESNNSSAPSTSSSLYNKKLTPAEYFKLASNSKKNANYEQPEKNFEGENCKEKNDGGECSERKKSNYANFSEENWEIKSYKPFSGKFENVPHVKKFKKNNDGVVNSYKSCIRKVLANLTVCKCTGDCSCVKNDEFTSDDDSDVDEMNIDNVTEEEKRKNTYKDESESESEDETDDEDSLSEEECEFYIETLDNFFLEVKDVERFDYCDISTDEIIKNIRYFDPDDDEICLLDFFSLSYFSKASEYCTFQKEKAFNKEESIDISEKQLPPENKTKQIYEKRNVPEKCRNIDYTLPSAETQVLHNQERPPPKFNAPHQERKILSKGETESMPSKRNTMEINEIRNLQANMSTKYRHIAQFNCLWPAAESLHVQKCPPPNNDTPHLKNNAPYQEEKTFSKGETENMPSKRNTVEINEKRNLQTNVPKIFRHIPKFSYSWPATESLPLYDQKSPLPKKDTHSEENSRNKRYDYILKCFFENYPPKNYTHHEDNKIYDYSHECFFKNYPLKIDTHEENSRVNNRCHENLERLASYNEKQIHPENHPWCSWISNSFDLPEELQYCMRNN